MPGTYFILWWRDQYRFLFQQYMSEALIKNSLQDFGKQWLKAISNNSFRILNAEKIVFKERDPAKRNEDLEYLYDNFSKIEKLEEAYMKERKKVKRDYKITIMKEVGFLKAGKGFGELALKNSAPRAASIKAVEDCDFATLSK